MTMCARKKTSLPEGLVRLAGAAAGGGVSRQTIEYYIALGLITPIRLPDRFGRLFDDKLIRRIKLIRKLNRSGYALRDIRETYFRNRR